MSKYSSQATLAEKLISMKGVPVTITRTTAGAYDPVTGGVTSTTTTLSGNGVFLNYTIRDIDGTNVLTGDRKVLYTGQEPKKGDYIGDEQIISVMPLNPDNSTAIMYTLQVRQ